MDEKSFDPKLPKGFNYSVRSGEMYVTFFCDCCGNEVKVSRKMDTKNESPEKSFQVTFDNLKIELDSKFHRCTDCSFLICPTCWENREEKCKDCPICISE
ncbi:MAG: hypothetical protein ACTSSH_09375 [Candidatus Heimdallarchaeota archaeon]